MEHDIDIEALADAVIETLETSRLYDEEESWEALDEDLDQEIERVLQDMDDDEFPVSTVLDDIDLLKKVVNAVSRRLP